MDLIITALGGVRAIYGELVDLAQIGELAIRRASHVEPDEEGRWWADMSPVGGPVLGPYRRRSQALQAEQSWLETHWLKGVRT